LEAAVNFRAILTSPVWATRRFVQMVFRKNAWRSLYVPRSKFDFATEVGDGTGSSTVMAPLLWIVRTYPEAPPMLFKLLPDGQEEAARQHPMLRLLQRPNKFYTAATLWMATLMDYYVDGNAYWIKLRDKGGKVRELWWAPHWTMAPRGDEKTFITQYDYSPGGTEALALDPNDVVHFRFGLDSNDQRKGFSPLKSVLREVFTDDEAANFTAQLLRNMGVPGIVVSPDGDQAPSETDVEETKAYIKARFTGDNRGEAIVMSGKTKVQQFGFSPDQMNLKDIRRIPEERVSAVLGVPAVVAGLGAGLDRSTFTNYAEAREAAYEQTIIPTQRINAEDMRFQLLTEFESDPFAWRVGFDLTNVRVLQEDRNRLEQRVNRGLRAGGVKRSEYRRTMGLAVAADGSDDVFLMPLNTAEVPADKSQPVRVFGKQASAPAEKLPPQSEGVN
jgi:HK97 family phage portal protein